MKRIFLSLLVLLMVSSCSPIGAAVGAGATLGVAAAREGGIKAAASDLNIKALISDKWFRYDVETFTKLNITVNQGRVLITGIVQNPDHRVEAVRLAWQVNGVEQVINEIRVAEGDGLPGFVKDQWITTRLRTELTFDRDVQSINYSIDTVAGTVYLMGIAQSQAELNKVIETARTISGVKQVVSYVKMAGESIEPVKGQPGDYPVDYNYSDGGAPVESYTSEPAPIQIVPQEPYYEPVQSESVYQEPLNTQASPPPVESEQLLWPDQ